MLHLILLINYLFIHSLKRKVLAVMLSVGPVSMVQNELCSTHNEAMCAHAANDTKGKYVDTDNCFVPLVLGRTRAAMEDKGHWLVGLATKFLLDELLRVVEDDWLELDIACGHCGTQDHYDKQCF